jgi:hypothetical protein
MWLGGSKAGMDAVDKRKMCPLPGTEPLPFQSIAGRCTEIYVYKYKNKYQIKYNVFKI